jgi:hypothetical protein
MLVLIALAAGALASGCAAPENAEVEVEIRNVGLDHRSQSPVVLLQDKAHRVALPIWIGPSEAQSIAMQLEGVNPPRPLTHDLMKLALEQSGVEFERVLITELKESTYYARIFLRSGRKDIELDSRPSDAIALAVRFHKPIFVARGLLQSETTIDLREASRSEGTFTFAGVTVQDLSDELAAYFGVTPGEGVLVSDVTPDATVALQRGDVIVAINGTTVASVHSVQTTLGALEAGAGADLSVQRGGERLQIAWDGPPESSH